MKSEENEGVSLGQPPLLPNLILIGLILGFGVITNYNWKWTIIFAIFMFAIFSICYIFQSWRK